MTGSAGLVCWSGGCDSTLVLLDLAKQSSASRPVRTFSISMPEQICGAVEQRRARKRILAKLRRGGSHIEPTEMILGLDHGAGLLGHGLPQAVVWLLGAQALRGQEDLYLGYIRGDDWWYHRGEFARVFERLQFIGGRKGAMHAPLEGVQKRGVIHRLNEAGLLDLTWWCDAAPAGRRKSRSEPCGLCSSCVAHETGAWQLEKWGPGFLGEGTG